VRLFVALEIPPDVRDNLAAFLRDMRELSEQRGEKCVKWVRAENLHVTLKFIGEVADTKFESIRSALATVRGDTPIDIQIGGMGFFPDEDSPTVFWTGLDASTNLPVLASDIDRALATQGIAREKRAFIPHLALARFAPPGLPEKLRAAIQKNAERRFGSFCARKFHLIESKLKPTGAEYTSLASFPIALEPAPRWPS
jgi:RNA 2',3'-cyclic 3'-phosphodiesterase